MIVSAGTFRKCFHVGLAPVYVPDMPREELFSNYYSYVEGSAFDLTIKSIRSVEMSDQTYIGKAKRLLRSLKELVWGKTKEMSPLCHPLRINPADLGEEILSLNAGYYVVELNEWVHTPDDWCGLLFPRRTFTESGHSVYVTRVAPGYKGNLVVGLEVRGPGRLVVDRGTKIAALMFETLDGGKSDPYGHHHWGGAVVGTPNGPVVGT